jgi:site-specific recombinase XerD
VASVYLRGKMFYCCYYENGVKFDISLKTRDKTVAKFKKNEIENKLIRGLSPLPRISESTQESLNEYLRYCENRVEEKTVEDYDRYVGGFLLFVNLKKLSSITGDDLQKYINHRLETGSSKNTANHIIRYVVTFFNYLVDKNILEKNQLAKFKRFSEEVFAPNFLSADQSRELLEKARSTTLYPAIATALYAGLRYGELKRLTWIDIDFNSSRIMVKKAKSKKFRSIPLHPDLKAILLKCEPKEDLCFDLVNQRNIMTALTGGKKQKPFIGWHDLRHTFISHLVMNGVDLRAVQEMAGHASIKTTMRYAHLIPGHLEGSIKKLKF